MLTLLIDDNTIDLFLNQRMLELTGIVSEFKTFSSSMDALDYFANPGDNFVQPDLVLLDIQMPELNGFQFLKRLCEVYTNGIPFKIFLLSSTINNADLLEAESIVPSIMLLEKPLNTNILKQHLAEI